MLLLAGEASGDEHGAALAAAIKARRPEVRFMGTGGPRMQAQGVELVAGLDDLAVMGFAEILPRIPFFRRLERKIEAILDDATVALVVLIDYPGFNMRIARAAKRRGLKVLYYIAPQVWAWRPGRARTLAEVADRVAVILPFEAAFLRKYGVQADYVGHPLLDRPDDVKGLAAFCERWGLDAGRPLLALLPGSRPQEIARHLDVFVKAAELVRKAHPEVMPVLSRAAHLPVGLFAGQSLPVVEDARGLLRHAQAALVKSGTATLEAAIEGVPMVVAYRTSAPTWMVARALVRTEFIALPNLIADERIVPECLQGAAGPSVLAEALIPLVESDGPEREAQLRGLAKVRQALGPPGATGRVAEVAVELIAGTP